MTDNDNGIRGRIYFPGSPWPNGHQIASFNWTALLHPQYGSYISDASRRSPALAMCFELTTEDYYAKDGTHLAAGEENEDDDESSDDWRSRVVWNNYNKCWIGPSQTSSAPGIPVSDGTKPFDFTCDEYYFSANPLPVDWNNFFQEQAFGIYLLGHDAVADHKIHLHSRQPDGSYTLDWSGKIALYYAGETDFEYDFIARVEGVRFDAISLFYVNPTWAKEYFGLDLDPNVTPHQRIAPFVANPDDFRIEERNGVLHAVYRT